MSSLLIKNARYLGDSVDLLVVDGKVQSLSASINAPADAEIVDAAGKILFPSFIDVHTHLREPGYEWKETVATGLSSAAHGGFGAILCMANTDPVNDDAAVTEQILESARRSWPNGPRVHPIGAATVGLKGEELTRMSELKDAGCVAISNDGRPVGNTEIFRRMLEYAADLDLIVIDHCEDPYLAAKSHMNEGVTSGVLGVKGQPTWPKPFRLRAAICWPTISACRAHRARFRQTHGRHHRLGQIARRQGDRRDDPALSDARRYRRERLQHARQGEPAAAHPHRRCRHARSREDRRHRHACHRPRPARRA